MTSIVYDLPEADYHAHVGSLSHSGAKLILKAPALYKHRLDHPERKDVWDFGAVAHREVLGVGDSYAVIPPTSRAKADQIAHRAAKEAAIAEGLRPITEADLEIIKAMADALRSNDEAMELLSGDGQAEVSLFAEDPITGVTLRGRIDWLPESKLDQRLVIADYKTTHSADAWKWSKAAADFGYEMQDAWYTDLAIACGLDPDPTFAFIVQEKTAPYLSAVYRLDADARAIGRHRNRKAIATYAQCVAENHWPGYQNDLALALPVYHLINHSEALA